MHIQVTKADLERHEAARRAIHGARKFKREWQAMARMMSRNSKLKVELTGGATSCTDGKTLFIKVPPQLAEPLEHPVPGNCSKRDEHYIPLCPSCDVLEDVHITVIHEVAHVIFGTFEEVTGHEKAQLLERAIMSEAEGQRDSKRAAALKRRIEQAPPEKKHDYLNLSDLISPYLPFLINACEDIRVNSRMHTERPGTRQMMNAQISKVFREGVMGYDGKMTLWSETPPNAQAAIGVYCKVGGYDWQGAVNPEIAEVLDDPGLDAICDKMRGARTMRDVYRLSFPLLENLRRLGFMKAPDEPEDQPEPETPPMNQEEDQSEPDKGDDEQGSEGEGSPESEEDDSSGSEGGPEEGEDSNSDGDAGDSGDPGEDGSEDREDGAGEPADGDSGGSDSGDGSLEEGPSTPSLPDDSGGESSTPPDTGDSDERQPGDSGESPPSGSEVDGSTDASDGDDGEGDPSEGDPSGADRGSDHRDQDGDNDGDPSEGDTPADDSADGEADDGESTGDQSGEDSSQDGDQGEPGSADPSDPGEERSDDGDGDPSDGMGDPDPSQGTEPGDHAPEDGDSGSSDEASPADGSEACDSPDGSPGGGDPGDQGDPAGHDAEASPQDFDGSPAVLGDEGSPPSPEAPRQTAPGQPQPPSLPPDTGESVQAPTAPQQDTGKDGVEAPEPYTEEDQERDGTPSDIEHLFKLFGGHESHESNPSEAVEEELMSEAIDLSLRQMDFFDSPSFNVEGVSVHRMDDDHLHIAFSDGIRRKVSATTIEVPETIISGSLSQLRVVFQDNRRAKHEVNRKSGKVNARVLAARVPTQDERIFKKTTQPGRKDYFVVIGIDCSGSTAAPYDPSDYNSPRLDLIKMAVYAKAEMLWRLKIPFALYAHSGGGHNVEIFELKSDKEPWGKKQKEALAALQPYSANLDGHSMEFYRKVAERRQETDRLLLYYTDGAMPASNYKEELEILQREIKTCERLGIHLVGIGVNSDSPKDHGLDTILLDDINDVKVVVKGLKERLLK